MIGNDISLNRLAPTIIHLTVFNESAHSMAFLFLQHYSLPLAPFHALELESCRKRFSQLGDSSSIRPEREHHLSFYTENALLILVNRRSLTLTF
jgi:hypothetical protein